MTIKPLYFGTEGRDGIHVDLDRLFESRLLVTGVSGSGKSTLLRSLLEQTFGQVPQLIIDSEGDFVTLREKFDYVLVGKGGDVPIAVKTAKVTMRRIAELNVSAIFDLSELRFAERKEWVRIACEELVHLPRAMWHTRLFVLDEMHVFCPERGKGESVATGAVIDVGTLGRKRGIVTVGATQRLSKLNNDIAGELNNKIIGFTDDIDLKRAGDQLGMTKEQSNELKLLDTHTFYAYGPAISRTRVLVRTNMPMTKPPPRGQDRPAAPPARAAVQKLLAQLADLPKEAEQEARNMEDLRKQLSERDREIRNLRKGVAPQTVEKKVVDHVAIDRAVTKARQEEVARARGVLTRVQRGVMGVLKNTESFSAALQPAIGEISTYMNSDVAKPETLLASAEHGRNPSSPVVSQSSTRSSTAPMGTQAGGGRERPASSSFDSDVQLSGTQRRMLNAMGQFYALGLDTPSRASVAGLCNVSHTTGTFSNNLTALRKAGAIVDIDSERIQLTDSGMQLAEVPDSPPSLDELHRTWYTKVSGTQAKMLEQVVNAYPNSISREAIADALGVQASTGTFSNNLTALRKPGLIVDTSKTEVKATQLLFPEGLS